LSHQQILSEVFGYDQFRGPQQAIVENMVAGLDALVLMPTGGGKSLCYQIPAIARQRLGHGVTIVVSPLIALMHDQVTAGAGIHGGDQLKTGRELGTLGRPGDGDVASLHRLAQRFQGRALEFRKLIEHYVWRNTSRVSQFTLRSGWLWCYH